MKKPDMRGHFKNWQVLENLPPALLYIGAIYAALFLVGSSHRLELPKLNMFQLCVLKWTCFRFHIVCGKACNCGGREGSAGENTFRNCHLDISIERLACVRGWRLRWPILWRRLSQGKISTCFGWPGCLMEFRRRKIHISQIPLPRGGQWLPCSLEESGFHSEPGWQAGLNHWRYITTWRQWRQPITKVNSQQANDSLKPGVNGVVNFLSRVVAGTLLDRIR